MKNANRKSKPVVYGVSAPSIRLTVFGVALVSGFVALAFGVAFYLIGALV
jgi:hypothetical protein